MAQLLNVCRLSMKRFILAMVILSSIFLMLIVAIRQTTAYHQLKAQEYMTQGLYDEAMQEFAHTTSQVKILKASVQLFGKLNALLVGLSILFFLSHLILKKSIPKDHVQKIKITKDFHPEI